MLEGSTVNLICTLEFLMNSLLCCNSLRPYNNLYQQPGLREVEKLLSAVTHSFYSFREYKVTCGWIWIGIRAVRFGWTEVWGGGKSSDKTTRNGVYLMAK